MANEADLKVKQQIVDKIKASTNILVTVSKDPSVDELSAAIGLATLLNKMDKHTTAIFSGAVPPAINFLTPDKVFENSADSLRDFIIALDKEKADHLRYKIEGDVVKIFITPYRTIITSDDLQFSQGDFNIELVLALGVTDQDHLDLALASHGQIMHDVTVATLSAGQKTSQLGSLDWHDQSAGSLCEMVVGIGESLKGEKPLLDKQIATALLTGIVAATDRFSNTNTSARVMTIAAGLMAAGADQQLIAAKLQESHTIDSVPASRVINTETEVPISSKLASSATQNFEEEIVPQSTLPPDNLVISHDSSSQFESTEPSESYSSTLPDVVATPANFPTQPSVYAESTLPPDYNVNIPTPEPAASVAPSPDVEPLLGGTLNATTDQAAEDARRELEEQQNKTILTHAYLSDDISSTPPLGSQPNPFSGIGQKEPTPDIDIFAQGTMQNAGPEVSLPLPPPSIPDFSTLPPPPLPNFVAPPVVTGPGSIPTIQPLSDDPSQFRIPGQ